jgi:hypothetical protein
MRGGEHTQHAKGLVAFDETHASHIRGQLENHLDAGGGGGAVLRNTKVKGKILHFRGLLIPVVERLVVGRAHNVYAVIEQRFHQVAANESTRSANQHFFSRQFHR